MHMGSRIVLYVLPSVFDDSLKKFQGIPCLASADFLPFAVCVPSLANEARAMAKHRGNKISESPPLLREQEGLIQG